MESTWLSTKKTRDEEFDAILDEMEANGVKWLRRQRIKTYAISTCISSVLFAAYVLGTRNAKR